MMIIDEIKDRIRLEDLVGETPTIRLRKSGANYVGFCPFHNNKDTPSLVVFVATQTWKCFGSCNDGGDVFDWVIKQNAGWDLKEAMRHLAGKTGVSLKSNDDLQSRSAGRIKQDALKVAMQVFRKWLFEDKEALAYAIDRGWTEKTLKAAGIGFSGRATAEALNELREELKMHGIDLKSPEAVMILGFKGNVKQWAQDHSLDAAAFGDKYIMGLMDKPALVYPHKFDGKIEYLSSRFLPGYDVERKSHNPNSVLAGPRVPYFNWLHKGHHAEGKPKGKRIHIVEGQGDAVAWGQFGEPAMALCGSSWRYLLESGIVEMLKNEYEEIFYSVDADTPGEEVLVGKNNEFPLSNAFGPTLWIERMPKIEWARPDKKTKAIKDVNDLAQYFNDEVIEDERQKEVVKELIGKALPIVVLAGQYAGKQQGTYKETTINNVVRPLILAMPNRLRLNYAATLAEAIYPNLGKTERMTLFNKWLRAELKDAMDDEDDEDFQIEQIMGGWFPDSDSKNSGYLIDLIYDKQTSKMRFAYAHIKDIAKNEREVSVANFIIIGNKKYIPPDRDENIECGAVKLPSALGPLKTSSELINLNAKFYEKYFYLDEKSRYKFCGSYSLFTWVNDSFEALNFLRMRGGSGSGKSDLAYLIGLTSYRFAVTLSTSSSASYKGLAKVYKATVMIDEADNLMKKDDGTMEAFLKGRSMKRYANVMNMMEVMTENGKAFIPTTTNVYGPTLITMYASFKDPGIENRCITFDLSQVDALTLDKAGMEPGYYPPELEDDAEDIRNLCLHWRLQTWLPKIELSPEQRTQYKLTDPLVSPRVNQVLRPMKVLAIMQNDMDMLEDLKLIGRANYEDEMIKRAGSFEALILRAVLAADIAADMNEGKPPTASKDYAERVKGYGELVKIGKLGRHGLVRYVLYKDVAKIANEFMDAENTSGEDDKKKNSVKGKTIGDVCRDSFRMPVERTGNGFAVILDRDRIDIAKLRFGLDREIEYQVGAQNGHQAVLPIGDEVNPL